MVIYRAVEYTYGPDGENGVGSYGLGFSNQGCHSYFATKNEAVKAIREAGYKPSHDQYPEIEKLELGNKADFIDLLNRA